MVTMRSVRKISRKDFVGRDLNYFLSGFVEGEGSFNVSLRRKADYKVSWQVVMSFNVSQKDPSILRILKEVLDCGIIKVRAKDNLHSYDVTNTQDLIEKVIPFFHKYPVLSESKKRNFAIFCKIASLMNNGEHRNLSGLKKILGLREELNIGKGRTRKYSINDVFPKEYPQRLHVN
jgi:hypothetical protein